MGARLRVLLACNHEVLNAFFGAPIPFGLFDTAALSRALGLEAYQGFHRFSVGKTAERPLRATQAQYLVAGLELQTNGLDTAKESAELLASDHAIRVTWWVAGPTVLDPFGIAQGGRASG